MWKKLVAILIMVAIAIGTPVYATKKMVRNEEKYIDNLDTIISYTSPYINIIHSFIDDYLEYSLLNYSNGLDLEDKELMESFRDMPPLFESKKDFDFSLSYTTDILLQKIDGVDEFVNRFDKSNESTIKNGVMVIGIDNTYDIWKQRYKDYRRKSIEDMVKYALAINRMKYNEFGSLEKYFNITNHLSKSELHDVVKNGVNCEVKTMFFLLSILRESHGGTTNNDLYDHIIGRNPTESDELKPLVYGNLTLYYVMTNIYLNGERVGHTFPIVKFIDYYVIIDPSMSYRIVDKYTNTTGSAVIVAVGKDLHGVIDDYVNEMRKYIDPNFKIEKMLIFELAGGGDGTLMYVNKVHNIIKLPIIGNVDIAVTKMKLPHVLILRNAKYMEKVKIDIYFSNGKSFSFLLDS